MAEVVSEDWSFRADNSSMTTENRNCQNNDMCGLSVNCEVQENLDTGYLSDSSTIVDIPLKRGRKRKEMCPDETEVKRVTANYQERQRMMKLNTGLDTLRQCLPDQLKVGNRRISKIRTLRLAASYIKSLGDILKQDAIIRGSLPPQPGFELRLPSLNEVNRQGDSGEMYTPEKELSVIPSPESLTYTPPDYRYPVYGHPHTGSSPHYPYNNHTTSSTVSHLQTFPHMSLQPYIPLYPPQFCPPGLQTLHHLPMGGAVMHHL